MKRPPGERIRLSKALLFRMIGYEIHTEEVRRFHESKARVRITSAPARTSKSYSAAADVMPDCFPDFWMASDGTVYPMPLDNGQTTRLIWVVPPDFRLAKEFDYLFTWLVDGRGRYGFGYTVERAQNNPEQGAMKIAIRWGKDWTGRVIRTVIEAKSASNERSLQAEEVYRVILSEAADLEERIWAKYISTRYGMAILPTTPKVRADWIRKMIDQSDNKKLGIEAFEYDGRANPSYDWERYWIEHSKAESRQGAQILLEPELLAKPPSSTNGHDCFSIGEACFASRDPHFAEQFMGRWTYAEARVIPFRWKAEGRRVSHVLEHAPEWCAHADKYVSMDYGYTDPAAASWWAVHADGTAVKIHELYQTALTPDEFVAKIVGTSKEKGWRIKSYLADPRKPEVLRHFQRLGIPCLRVDKNRQSDRQAGFMALSDMLSDDPVLGRPKLYVLRHCIHTIQEYKLLRRKEGHHGDEFSGGAIVGADHLVDADRYFLTAYPRGESDVLRTARSEAEKMFEFARENARHGIRIPRHPAAGGVPGLIR